MSDSPNDVEHFGKKIGELREQIGRVIVGHRDVIDGVLTCVLAGSHALLEGVPGLGKTSLVRTIAAALDLEFTRIQFTPDLMPADIIGTTVIDESADGKRAFEFRKGPLFANIVLADEINRATPKTQSALLEAMQERRVTVGRTTHEIAPPYFVLATQNPLEMEGTYPLPEAQLDRFLFKIDVKFPTIDQLVGILERTTGSGHADVSRAADGKSIVQMGRLGLDTPIASHISRFVAQLTVATHPDDPSAPDIVRRYVRYGASPRGAQSLIIGAKLNALLDGRFNVSFDDVRAVALPALRHRVLLNFEGLSEGITTDEVITDLIGTLEKSAV